MEVVSLLLGCLEKHHQKFSLFCCWRCECNKLDLHMNKIKMSCKIWKGAKRKEEAPTYSAHASIFASFLKVWLVRNYLPRAEATPSAQSPSGQFHSSPQEGQHANRRTDPHTCGPQTKNHAKLQFPGAASYDTAVPFSDRKLC